MQPPKIDSRDFSYLLRQMREMVPYYTPEWRFTPEDPDPGTALFHIFADMYMENVQRLNKVPLKNFIAFMNTFDVSLISAKPATAYVTFALSEGAGESVYVPKGTPVSAAAEDGGDDILFETEKPLLITPARLAEMLNVAPAADAVCPLPVHIFDKETAAAAGAQGGPERLFDPSGEGNLQRHSMYIAHSFLFDIRQGAVIELVFSNSQKRFKEAATLALLADPRYVEWSYGTGQDRWTPFDEVKLADKRLLLTKRPGLEIAEQEIMGVTNRFVQCCLRSNVLAPDQFDYTQAEINGLVMKADYADGDGAGGAAPEFLLFNDIQLNAEGFYPFGEHFLPFAAFYICSREVFSKRGSAVTLKFRLKTIENRLIPETEPEVDWKLIMKESKFEKQEPMPVSILKVNWEYWNGSSWVNLMVNPEASTLFYRPEEADKIVAFECPEDLEETFVNAQFSFWIRARVLSIENLYAVNAMYQSPWMEQVRLTYRYGENRRPAQHLLIENNMEGGDRTLELGPRSAAFHPFVPLDCGYPAVYFGFETPPVRGPIHLYFSFLRQNFAMTERPIMEWEYLRRSGTQRQWTTLKAIDQTMSFSQSGTVQFSGPDDFALTRLFDHELYWIRVLNRDRWMEKPNAVLPMLEGVHMNTSRVIQQESVSREFPERAFGEWGEEYRLAKSPVVSERVWVDETGAVSDHELQQIKQDSPDGVEVIMDAGDNVQKVWVLWGATEHFYDSQSEDRHYVIDRSTGIFRFGNGKQGRTPPNAGSDKIRVDYKVVGGSRGNVAAGAINNLQVSLAFIDHVYNPEPSGGGCDMETLQEVMLRGPKVLRHRDRAVTAEDFEWLARESDPNIAKIKCLANYNAELEREIGCITLIVLPRGGPAGLQHFTEMKKRVEAYMLERAAGMVAFPGKIQVLEPAYLEISVYTVLAVADIEDAVPAELEAVEKLNRFLDPFTGNYEGKGWDIGQQVHISIFYALLQSISAINHVESISLSVYKTEYGVREEFDPNRMDRIMHGIVVNGVHKVVVKAI